MRAYPQHSALHPIIGLFERASRFESDDPREARASANWWRRSAATARTWHRCGGDPGRAVLRSLRAPPRRPSISRRSGSASAPSRSSSASWPGSPSASRSCCASRTALGRPLHRRLPVAGARPHEDRRVMMVLTHRPMFSPAWSAEPGTTHIRLDRSGDGDVRTMVGTSRGQAARRRRAPVHRGEDGWSADLRRGADADGAGRGSLVETEDGDTARGPPKSITIPVTLQDLLLARLDRLGRAKDLALLASVLGREFTYGMMRSVFPSDEAALVRDLDHLVATGSSTRPGSRPPPATPSSTC